MIQTLPPTGIPQGGTIIAAVVITTSTISSTHGCPVARPYPAALRPQRFDIVCGLAASVVDRRKALQLVLAEYNYNFHIKTIDRNRLPRIMTPAILSLKKHRIPHQIHEYPHDSSAQSYGLEAAEKLGVPGNRVFKTLVVKSESDSLMVTVIPVTSQLSMKRVARAAGTKKVAMAKRSEVERSTGYVLGGVSAIGQKKRLPTFIEQSAQDFATIYISAGRRGLELELTPADLIAMTHGRYASLCQC